MREFAAFFFVVCAPKSAKKGRLHVRRALVADATAIQARMQGRVRVGADAVRSRDEHVCRALAGVNPSISPGASGTARKPASWQAPRRASRTRLREDLSSRAPAPLHASTWAPRWSSGRRHCGHEEATPARARSSAKERHGWRRTAHFSSWSMSEWNRDPALIKGGGQVTENHTTKTQRERERGTKKRERHRKGKTSGRVTQPPAYWAAPAAFRIFKISRTRTIRR